MKIYQLAQESNVPVIINSAELVCPFCKDAGFDLAGLKSHLLKGDCEAFNDTENIERLMWESERGENG